MGSFGNFISVRSLTSRRARRRVSPYSQDTTAIFGSKWELVYYQWKKLSAII
jgi:hypothetical protein